MEAKGSASSKPTSKVAQLRLSRSKGRPSSAKGYKLGCVCCCMKRNGGPFKLSKMPLSCNGSIKDPSSYTNMYGNSLEKYRGRGQNFPIFIACHYLVELGPRQLGLPVADLSTGSWSAPRSPPKPRRVQKASIISEAAQATKVLVNCFPALIRKWGNQRFVPTSARTTCKRGCKRTCKVS